MEAKGSKGYLLPEVIDPGELQCLVVFIPKDDYYLRAFSGAYHRLGTWQVWEKDGTTRAAQASAVWKDAIDYTMANGWIGACMTTECCEAIVEAINNISITVNVTCGGGGTSIDREWRLPDDWEAPLPETVPTPSTDETAVSSGDLCDTAHQTHARIYEFLDTYPELVQEESPYDSLIAYIQAILIFAVPPAGVLFEWMSDVTGRFYDYMERDTLAFWDGMRDEFVCAIVEHNNAASFYTWLTEYITDNAPNFAIRTWLLTVLQMVEWSLLYDGEFAIEPEYVGSDCSSCGSPESGSYIVRQYNEYGVLLDSFPVDGGNTLVFTNEAHESHFSSPADPAFLYLFDVIDADTMLSTTVNVTINSSSGWTAPANINHPICVQGRLIDNSYFTVVPLGGLPDPFEQINNTKWIALHSASQFSVTLLIGDI